MTSSIGIVTGGALTESRNPIDGKFSISDEWHQYFGKYNSFFLIFLFISLNRLS
jgi:hypothetical protein